MDVVLWKGYCFLETAFDWRAAFFTVSELAKVFPISVCLSVWETEETQQTPNLTNKMGVQPSVCSAWTIISFWIQRDKTICKVLRYCDQNCLQCRIMVTHSTQYQTLPLTTNTWASSINYDPRKPLPTCLIFLKANQHPTRNNTSSLHERSVTAHYQPEISLRLV
jgi:hypothetical protein